MSQDTYERDGAHANRCLGKYPGGYSSTVLASVDRKKTPDWSIDRRRIFRIGYYNRNDGLDCIWLVNGAGDYEQTTDRKSLLEHFVILHLSDEQDLYVELRRPLKALQTARTPASALRGCWLVDVRMIPR
jgi:hypothetical protein